MADIFLSYAREDAARARQLAEVLQSYGWSVWWDHQIPHGKDFRAVIQQQLAEARCVVVLWSRAAVTSQFVLDEATEGLNGRLVPCLIEAIHPPLGFRQLQTANLTTWNGEQEHDEYRAFVDTMSAIVPPRSTSESTGLPRNDRDRQVSPEWGPLSGSRPRVRPSVFGGRRAAAAALVTLGIAILLVSLWATSRFRAGGAHTAGSSNDALLANRRMTDVERQKIEFDAGRNLSELVKSTLLLDGGCRISIDDPGFSPPENWSSAQCVAALLQAPEAQPDVYDEIRRTLHLFSARRRGDGWTVIQSMPQIQIESTAWVGLAFLAALNARANDFLRSIAERDDVMREIGHVHQYLTQRQSGGGGWGSFETEYVKPSASTDYSTFLALRFLLELRKSPQVSVDRGILDEQIRRALAWVMSRYDVEAKGWSEHGSAVGAQKDLATLYLLVLTEANQAGFGYVMSNSVYQMAVGVWIPAALQDSVTRKLIDNSDLRQDQDLFSKSGAYLGYKQQSASILWHPWSLLLSSYLVKEKSLSQSQRDQAQLVQDQLVRRLPEAAKAFSRGFIFKAAEMLYVVGLLS